MTPADAFLCDIIEHPEDDAPRLVYADWLDDHGQPERAEFIRLQCRLASLPDRDPQGPALRQREGELLQANRDQWTAGLKGLVRDCRFERGFVCWVETSGEQFIEHGGRLLDLAPIRSVRLGPRARRALQLVDCPHLAR